jgi:hypothetical protein
MQGQDLFACLWALGLRSGATLAQVEAAFNTGSLVRSWPMRGTLHVVCAEDVGWLQQLTVPRRISASLQTRWRQLGLDERTVEKARDLATAALSGGNALTRDALMAKFAQGGIEITLPRKYHLISYLTRTGTLVFGPLQDGEHLLVLAQEWIRAPRQLDGEAALAELAARYVAAHGPATIEDMSWWCGLGKRVCAEAFALAGDRVTTVSDDAGRTFWLDPEVAASAAKSDDVALMPAFDEHLLGYTDRALALSPRHARKVDPGGNGVFRPTLAAGGVCVGLWKGATRGALRKLAPDAPVRVTVTGFTPTHAKRVSKRALQKAANHYAHYLGRPQAVIVLKA